MATDWQRFCNCGLHENFYTLIKGETVTGLGGNFAYLRTRRIITETISTEIQHQQIWTALQLIHETALTAFNPDSTIQQLQTADNTVMYLCVRNLTDKEITAVSECLKNQPVTVYSWQPTLLTQYILDENLDCKPIPKFLVDRFGTLKT